MVSSSKRGPTAIPLGSLQESINVPSSNDVDVSIVICTRDRAKLLDRMLSSLEDSARRVAYEVIAVEGGSCDNTVEVLRKHHVTQIYNEAQCLGQGRHSWPQLYNFGFSKARGKWAMYASDDIVFGQGCIDRAVEYLNRQKDEVAGGIFFYRNLHATDPQWSEYGIDFTYGPRLLMNYGLVRLDRFMEVGGLDEAYEFYCADSDLCYKLYETSKHLIPLAHCFVDHNNILDARKSCNMAAADKDIQRLLHKWRNYVTSDLPRPRRLIWTQDVEDALRLSDELEEMGSCIENYWHGLACLEQGLFQDAREEFARVTDSGISHWRVWWYLAKSVRKCQEIEFCKESTSFVL